jgi:hypothetical protein
MPIRRGGCRTREPLHRRSYRVRTITSDRRHGRRLWSSEA